MWRDQFLEISSSPLLRNGGYAVFNDWLIPEWQTVLLREGWEQLLGGKREEVETSDSEEWRGGCPARRLMAVPGGNCLDVLYHSENIHLALQNLTERPVRPSGQRGQYIFYSEPGDFLSLHRDVEPCDLVIITCLSDNRPHEATGGTLYCYPTRQAEPLSRIRQTSAQGCVGIKLTRGQSLIFFGGRIPHGTIPIVPGQVRVVATLCFQS